MSEAMRAELGGQQWGARDAEARTDDGDTFWWVIRRARED